MSSRETQLAKKSPGSGDVSQALVADDGATATSGISTYTATGDSTV